MSNKILCEISVLAPLAEAVRNTENKTDLYSLKDLSLKASALLANGSSDEFLDELNAVNGTAASTMEDAVDNTETLVGSQTDLIAQIASALEGKVAGEDVSAETAEYTTLLTELEETIDALPDGGGNETLETCTVIVQFANEVSVGKYWGEHAYAVSYYKLVDGVKTETEVRFVKGVDYTMMGVMEPKFTLDCVCGTRVFSTLADLVGSEYTIDVPEEIDDFQFLRSTSDPTITISAMGYVFTAPKEPGTYTITITY